MRKTLSVLVTLLSVVTALAQSKEFTLGKNLEIEYAVLGEVASSYVDTVDFEKMISSGIESMLSTLDPYTVYFPEEEEEDVELMTTGNYGGVGSLIRKMPGEAVRIVEPYEGTPAVKAGLEPGDCILEIDGVPVYGETSEQSSERMKGQPGTDVHFRVVKGRTGDTVNVVVTRERIHISSVVYAGMVRDTVGYVYIDGFTSGMHDEFRSKVLELKSSGARRLVIDLRDNGGGVMEEAVELVSLFVPKGTLVVSSKGRGQAESELRTVSAPLDTAIPLLVLINSASASASEITAGALQDLDRATVAGVRSYGKGLIQSIKPLPYNGKVKITTGKYYTPSGRCVQAIDYSHRNEDGSVGYVPDSLRKAFKTRAGRTVYDGGGITPDIQVEAPSYSRTAAGIVYADIDGDFAIEYYKKHPSIPAPADFHLSDAEYEEFVQFAAAQSYDLRSASQTALDALVKAAQQDGLYELYKTEIEALKARVEVDKAQLLRDLKSELLPLVETEIVVKYYFKGQSTIIALRNDPQLDKALEEWQ